MEASQPVRSVFDLMAAAPSETERFLICGASRPAHRDGSRWDRRPRKG